MTLRYTMTEVSIPSTLYTANTRVSGNARANYHWLTDLLNAADRNFVLLEDAVVRSLVHEVAEELRSRSVLLRKENVIIGVPSDLTEVQEGAASFGSISGGDQRTVVVKAGPFSIEGTLQLARGAGLLQYLTDASWVYLPITDVTVSHDAVKYVRFSAPYVLVNRNWVDALLEEPEASAVVDTGSQAPDQRGQGGPAPAVQEGAAAAAGALSGEETAEILFASDVFKASDWGQLRHTITNLMSAGAISRQDFPTGTPVVRQGERGDTLYIVESGNLDVIIEERATEAPRVLAKLGPGDVFGEMALLGDGRRTATIRATSDVTLLALTADSWRELSHHLPAATTDLLRIMAQRRGPRGVLLRRTL